MENGSKNQLRTGICSDNEHTMFKPSDLEFQRNVPRKNLFPEEELYPQESQTINFSQLPLLQQQTLHRSPNSQNLHQNEKMPLEKNYDDQKYSEIIEFLENSLNKIVRNTVTESDFERKYLLQEEKINLLQEKLQNQKTQIENISNNRYNQNPIDEIQLTRRLVNVNSDEILKKICQNITNEAFKSYEEIQKDVQETQQELITSQQAYHLDMSEKYEKLKNAQMSTNAEQLKLQLNFEESNSKNQSIEQHLKNQISSQKNALDKLENKLKYYDSHIQNGEQGSQQMKIQISQMDEKIRKLQEEITKTQQRGTMKYTDDDFEQLLANQSRIEKQFTEFQKFTQNELIELENRILNLKYDLTTKINESVSQSSDNFKEDLKTKLQDIKLQINCLAPFESVDSRMNYLSQKLTLKINESSKTHYDEIQALQRKIKEIIHEQGSMMRDIDSYRKLQLNQQDGQQIKQQYCELKNIIDNLLIKQIENQSLERNNLNNLQDTYLQQFNKIKDEINNCNLKIEDQTNQLSDIKRTDILRMNNRIEQMLALNLEQEKISMDILILKEQVKDSAPHDLISKLQQQIALLENQFNSYLYEIDEYQNSQLTFMEPDEQTKNKIKQHAPKKGQQKQETNQPKITQFTKKTTQNRNNTKEEEKDENESQQNNEEEDHNSSDHDDDLSLNPTQANQNQNKICDCCIPLAQNIQEIQEKIATIENQIGLISQNHQPMGLSQSNQQLQKQDEKTNQLEKYIRENIHNLQEENQFNESRILRALQGIDDLRLEIIDKLDAMTHKQTAQLQTQSQVQQELTKISDTLQNDNQSPNQKSKKKSILNPQEISILNKYGQKEQHIENSEIQSNNKDQIQEIQAILINQATETQNIKDLLAKFEEKLYDMDEQIGDDHENILKYGLVHTNEIRKLISHSQLIIHNNTELNKRTNLIEKELAQQSNIFDNCLSHLQDELYLLENSRLEKEQFLKLSEIESSQRNLFGKNEQIKMSIEKEYQANTDKTSTDQQERSSQITKDKIIEQLFDKSLKENPQLEDSQVVRHLMQRMLLNVKVQEKSRLFAKNDSQYQNRSNGPIHEQKFPTRKRRGQTRQLNQQKTQLTQQNNQRYTHAPYQQKNQTQNKQDPWLSSDKNIRPQQGDVSNEQIQILRRTSE